MSNNKDFKVKNSIQPTVYQEGLGTVVSGSVGYSLSSGSYDSVSFSVASQDANPTGVAFNSDGTKMYITGNTNDNVFQYTLSTAFDVSTASYDNVSLSVTPQTTVAVDLTFKPDGSVLYVSGTTAVYQYTLTTNYDLTTASYASKSLTVSGQENSNQGAALSADGTKVYIVGTTNRTVYQYTLSTAWDLSTGSYASKSLSVTSQDTQPRALTLNNDGTKLYVLGQNSVAVFQYNLSTAYDVSTGSYDSINFSVSSQEGSPHGFVFGDSGSKLYVLGLTNDTIYQYSTVLNTASLDLSTGSVFEITPTSDIEVALSNPASSGTSSGATLLLNQQADSYNITDASFDNVTFSVAGQEVNPSGIFIGDNGTKMYICGITGDDVNQYTLSTAYDLSTASYSSVYSVATNAANPRKVQFNLDGTKMFIAGQSAVIAEYNLSTAWSVTTSSFDSSFSTASQTSTVIAFMFNADGTKFYAGSGSVLYQYSLSTAFDVSTASYDTKSLNTNSQDNQAMYGFRFNGDGTKLISIGSTTDSVYVYNLSTPYDISTATYSSISFSVASQESTPFDLAFKPDGTKMYIVGTNGDEVNQYTTGAGDYTITYPTSLQWPSGTAPTAPTDGDTDVITFNTIDGGTTYKSVLAIDGAS